MSALPNVARDLRDSLKEPAFWCYASWLDLIVKYRRTSLGMLWMMLPPFVFAVVLGTVYAQLMGFTREHYLPYLGAGYLLWRIIIQVLSDSTGVLRAHKSFIFDGRTRLTDYLLRVLAKATLYFVGSVPLLIGLFLWSPETSAVNLLSLIITLPVFMLAMFVVATHLAFFGARYPDTAEFTNTILVFAFLVTPILWYPHQAQGGFVLRFITQINPAYHLMEVVRQPLFGHLPGSTSLIYLALFFLLGGLSTAWLYRRYSRFVALWI
jgi:ABC-type polysaccharide/polyol phosphate export permease